MPGRIRVLDDGKRREICAMVSYGCTLQAAAKYVGCSRATIHREAVRNDEFGEQLRRAERDAHLRPVHTLQEAAADNWRAAAWLLERTHPDDYARKPPNLIRMQTVEDFVTRCLDMIEAELSGKPENQALCLRLTQAIEDSCNQLAAAARTDRNPRRLRQIIDPSLPLPESNDGVVAAQDELRRQNSEIAN